MKYLERAGEKPAIVLGWSAAGIGIGYSVDKPISLVIQLLLLSTLAVFILWPQASE